MRPNPASSKTNLYALIAFLLCLRAHIAFADPLHAIDAGAFQHENSGWIFPQRVADFVRVGAAQMIDGSDDAIAYYERIVAGVRKTALVHLHSQESGSVKAGADLHEESFIVRSAQRTLRGTKSSASSKPGEHEARYWIDTGPWAVEVRASFDDTEEARALDTFVRELRWESLALADQT